MTLPNFADDWVQQWKSAAPKLKEIRDRELREMDQVASKPKQRRLSHAEARSHGLAIQQAWFVRMKLLSRDE